jgi:outer membrane protein, heavy metal efflux system
LSESRGALFNAREKLNLLLGLAGKETAWRVSRLFLEPVKIKPSGEELELLALSRRPELKRASHEIEALGAALGIEEKYRLVPEFQLGVDAEGEDRSRIVVGPNLALQVPIFNQGEGRVVKTAARLRQAQRLYLAEAAKISSEVRSALNKVRLAESQIKFDKDEIIPLTKDIFRNTQLQYNAMLTGVFDLLHSKRAELKASEIYNRALRDYWISVTELKKAAGGEIELSSEQKNAPSAEREASIETHVHAHHQGDR